MKIPLNGGVPVGATAANFCEDTAEKKSINPELWQACAGPLVNLPPIGTHVLYFPQGHSEQVAASMKRDIDVQIPSYPNLPSKLLCMLHNVTLHADPETDEVYAQMTLQPVLSIDKEALLRSDLATKIHKPQTEFFCKMLTASDTSTHGGFSVPRRAAEKIFPALDFTMQPPAQEIRARDLHDNSWTFRHIFRGQPKRHLLTTGWSLFVSGKRLSAGDSVLFIRDEKQQLLLGIRRANRQPPNLSSSVLSNDSMHIGILAAAAHADANKSPFTVFFNPRASPSEFVIPLARYYKAVFSSHISLGMRFRMMFETEDSGTRRYMGTITNVSDLDPIRWKNSQWRNLQVGWDESTTGEKRSRVSVWEIEPVTAPFFFCPPPFIRPKRPRQPGLLDDEVGDVDNLLKRTMPWGGDEMSFKDPQALPGLSLVQWIAMQQNPSHNPLQINPNYINPGADISRQIAFSSPQTQTNSNLQHQQYLNVHPRSDQLSRHNLLNYIPPSDPTFKPQILQPQCQNSHQFQRQEMMDLMTDTKNSHQFQRQEMMGLMTDNKNSHQFQRQDMMGLMTDNKISHQLLEKLQHQHQSLLFHQSPQIAPAPTNRILTAGGVQSAVTDDVPSCSTSPSTNNCPNAVQLPATTSTANIMMDLPLKSDFRPQGLFGQNTYSNVGGGGLMDHMETSSSSATSASFSQNDTNTLLQSFNQQPVVFRGHENMDDGRLGLPLISEALAGEEMVDSVKNFNFFDMPGFENYRDPQQELPSSMAAASQSYCAPEMSFHSVDSTLNDEGFMNMGVWPPQAPKLPRMRTFTKVYKRGAVGRSIDMSRYSGYDELKQDLARRFGIEGQLEDPHRSGWKLVYLDHENDILLVGDDPWEEFVSCVRCIKILSPQEVEQMSLDGDLGQQNQGCSSSEAGNV